MMRCQAAEELRTFSRSRAEVGTRMGDGQEKRSSRWGVPLAVVLLARASCHSLGLSVGPSPPLSERTKPISILGVCFDGFLVSTKLGLRTHDRHGSVQYVQYVMPDKKNERSTITTMPLGSLLISWPDVTVTLL